MSIRIVLGWKMSDGLTELSNVKIRHYILDENRRIKAVGLYEWAQWYEEDARLAASGATCKRVVKQEHVGDAKVSTVFLALDHNWDPDGPPILWETMVFGGEFDEIQDRCSGGIEQAEAMHERMMAKVTGGGVVRSFNFDE